MSSPKNWEKLGSVRTNDQKLQAPSPLWWDLEQATKNMKVYNDYKILFLEVVKGSENLEKFVNWVYCDDFSVRSLEYKHQEYAKNCLECHLSRVQFIEARFIEKNVAV